MARIKHLPSKKERLKEKLETFLNDRINETQFSYMGRCGNCHTIETKVDKAVYGITPGEFIKWGNQLLLFVGIGVVCNHDLFADMKESYKHGMWFAIPEIEKGIVYRGYTSLNDLREHGITVTVV